MDKREFLGSLGLLAVGAGLGVFVRDYFDRDADRRFALYNIRRELRKGMTRDEVGAVVARHDTPYIIKREWPDKLSLTVETGLINRLYLSLHFSDGVLTEARFGGEDHPQDVPADVPSNIE